MRKSIPIIIATLIAVATWTHLGAGPETWIVVKSGGKDRVAFSPATEPYTEGGPAVRVFLEKTDARTRDGLVVTGFEFIGWKEASTNRVLVFALIPRDGAPNTYMPDGDEKNLRRQDFAALTMRDGQTLPIEGMKVLGIEPMILRATVRKTARL